MIVDVDEHPLVLEQGFFKAVVEKGNALVMK